MVCAMKTLIWICVGMMAVCWSGLSWLWIELLQFSVEQLGHAERTEDLGRMVEQWPLPDWLAPWVDPAWAAALRAGLQGLLTLAASIAPWLGSALGWLLPLAWIAWALGLLLLGLSGAGLHLLIRRTGRTPAAA